MSKEVLNMQPAMDDYLARLPKCELHIHIEGAMTPELMLTMASRNGIEIPYSSQDDVRAAFEFTDLQSFLDILFVGGSVLVTEQDYYDLTWDYLERIHADNVRHTEPFIELHQHTERGISLETVFDGMTAALKEGEQRFGITSRLIADFYRHLPAQKAFDALEAMLPFREHVVAVGLASTELGNPPSKFTEVFDEARRQGFATVAHAGEEGPPEYVWEALDLLKVRRIDHGVRSFEDPRLVERLVAERIPLTVCPLSNVSLAVFPDMRSHNFKQLLDAGVTVTINSDDPGYFGGYMLDNYRACAEHLDLTMEDFRIVTVNAFEASFLPADEKARHVDEVDAVYAQFAAVG